MTLQELKNEIAALGFEGEIDDTRTFAFAVKRAIATIYTERGIHKTLRIYQRNPKPSFHISTLCHEGGEVNTFNFSGGAYFFRVSGVGSFTVVDRNGVHEYEFNSSSATVRGFIAGDGEISFYGNYCYTVYDLCHFDELISDKIEDVNYNGCCEYDIKKMASDYLGPADRPKDSSGAVIEGCKICSGTLTVPYSYEGEIVFTYRCRPPFDTDIDPECELDIDPECEHLLPILCAAYVWLDDDADKAQYYMSLYREGMAALKLYSPRCINAEYSDVTGWA